MNEQLEINFDYCVSIDLVELPYNKETKTGYIKYTNGDKVWFLNGDFHRIDGPAAIDGHGTKYWYLHGIEYSETEYNRLMNARTA